MNSEAAGKDLEVRETFKVTPEFAPHVTVTEETFFSHGWQPLTITVLQSLWFLPADATFDIPFLVDWFAELGWKGANGKPMGANVIRREIGLIRDAGYISVTRLRGESGQAVGIQYSVSQRRTDQPENGTWVPVLPGTEQIRRSHHMPPMATRGQSLHVAIEEKPSSGHMPPMTTRGQSPHAGNGAKSQVAPHATNGSHPPHPPEGEGGTSSPVDKHATASRRDKQQPQPYDDAALKAAAAFLMKLPGKWAAGVQRARNLAPLLLENAALTGWDLDLSLRMYLARPEPGKKEPDNYGAVLAHRVKNLKPREAVLAAAAEDEQQEPAPAPNVPQAPAWCGECDSPDYRWIAPEAGPTRKCPTCHPQMAARRP